MKLRQIFEIAKGDALPDSWIYLPKDEEWTLDTDGLLLDVEEEEKDEHDVPLVAKNQNLVETLDFDTIHGIVKWASHLAGKVDMDACLDVFRYYCRFDAFPDRLQAPDPLPIDEIIANLDRDFYDALGTESKDRKCRKDACPRGTVPYSAFCRVHHFEMVKKKPSPFAH